MNDSFMNKKINFIINIIYYIVILVLFYALFKYVLPLVLPFIIAFFVAYFVEPSVLFFCYRFKIKRQLASIISILFFSTLIVFVALVLSVTVYDQLKNFYTSVPTILDNTFDYFESLIVKDGISRLSPIEQLILNLFEYIKEIDFAYILNGNIGNAVIGFFSNFMKSIPNILFTILITVISSIFISASLTDIKKFILTQFNRKSRTVITEIKSSVLSVLKKYIKSYAVILLITFIELVVLFLIFNIKPAISLAFIISVVDLLPVLGVGTVLIPWGLFCFVIGDFTKGIVLLSIYGIVMVVRQIIEPKVIGENIGLPAVVTIIAVFLGLKILGIFGAFLLPIIIIIVKELQEKGLISIWNINY